MKKWIKVIAIPFMALFLSQYVSAAADTTDLTAVVNVNDLFNSSSYVKEANKKLQDNAKRMDEKLKADQAKLQKQINDYQTMKNAEKKGEMAKRISDEQSRLTKVAQDYQANIQKEQAQGMQEFTQLVRAAVEKVAKAKNIHHVLNTTALIYTDESWIDITKDVAAAMEKK